MRILITGGAGCLGSNLIEYWLPRGHEILAIDNFVTGKREVVPTVDGLQVCEGTIEDESFVEACFSTFKPEVVIHAAASYKDPNDWKTDAAVNVVGSGVIVRASERHQVKRLINFQTALCYGRPSKLPIPINHPVAPFTSYGISKTAGEQYVLLADVPVVSLRLANITGPRLAIGPIPTFYKRLKAGQGCFCSDSQRDFLDMQDFLEFMDLVIVDGAPTGIFNVSTGESNSIKEIFDLVAKHHGIPAPEVPIVPVGDDDVPAVVLDSSHTEAVFGWKPKHGFESIITRQLRWYDEYGVNDVYSHLKPAAE
ncbi:NAD-dependent epimerase/dehydratase family protein [Marinobacterium sp. xm-d-530]|uniref:NAD-dependent epimerase/dehydratase family protein n=1 Tax=Marinobacterium sp. xm-d-530 TaxID=2497747 RepID=UPI001567F54D|nr:UDP-glucose 4-epimerase [Marinobacterium sp. xm-d-530]